MMKKHIVCFGDSNTHGYCADPSDTETHSDRFSENERWTCLLQEKLGAEYYVIEEGLSGRTTVFDDALHEKLSGLDSIYSCLMSHEPVDLLIIMLGTNDCCAELGLSAEEITAGLEKLIDRAMAHLREVQDNEAKIIIIAPKAMDERVLRGSFSDEVDEKGMHVSQELPALYKKLAERKGCGFTDIEDIIELSETDGEHFRPEGGQKLARKLKEQFF